MTNTDWCEFFPEYGLWGVEWLCEACIGEHFFVPTVWTVEEHTIPAISVPKKDGELLWALVTREPGTTLGISGPKGPVASPRHENLATFSSGGPTLDGRVKPDVVAPGDRIWSAGLVDHNIGACAVVGMSGTSMATPLAAGSMALLRQYFVDGFYPTGSRNAADAFEPSAALLRAVAINGAVAMEGFDEVGEPLDPPPSPRQGWGRLSLASSVVLAPEHGVDASAADVPTAAVVWDESSARTLRAPGETIGFCLDVAGPEEALRVTLSLIHI